MGRRTSAGWSSAKWPAWYSVLAEEVRPRFGELRDLHGQLLAKSASTAVYCGVPHAATKRSRSPLLRTLLRPGVAWKSRLDLPVGTFGD
jgi:hypothetical protein